MSRTCVEQIIIVLYYCINILLKHSSGSDVLHYYSKEWLHILLVYSWENTCYRYVVIKKRIYNNVYIYVW